MQKLFTLLLLLGLFARVSAHPAGAPGSNIVVAPLADTIPPVITCPASSTVSTEAFYCSTEYEYTIIATDDEPGVTWSQLLGWPSGTPFPPGVHVNSFIAADATGNTSTCSFTLTVRDYTTPVAVCDEFTVVSIGTDDPDDCYYYADSCHFGGHVWVNAATFDDGSYDNCGSDLLFTIRRMAPYSDCINSLNVVNGNAPCDDVFPDFPSEFERAISEQQAIKFYGCEVGTAQVVAMRVYQLDANGNIDLNANGQPIFNECLINVEIQDKIKPVVQCPASITVQAVEFDTTLNSYGVATLVDNVCLDPAYDTYGQCGLEYTVDYSQFDTMTHTGTLVRNFRAYDCSANSSKCSQQIVVENTLAFFVRFPDDVVATTCDPVNDYGMPQLYNPLNRPLAVSYEDVCFYVVPDACKKLERTFTIIDWYTYDPNEPCIAIPNPNPNAVLNHPTNLYGPIVSLSGADEPWTSTVTKINPDDPVATDFSIFWDPGLNCFTYKQIIKIIDTEQPEQAGGAVNYDVLDASPNHESLWNEPYWDLGSGPDRPEAVSDLDLVMTDNCAGTKLEGSYLLFLDLNNDGTQETVVNSKSLPEAGTVNYDNAQLPGFEGGTPRTFDERPVAAGDKYRFALQKTSLPTSNTYQVMWNTGNDPTNFVAPELPYGNHKIRWNMEDECGNVSSYEYPFTLSGVVSGTDIPGANDMYVGQNTPNPYTDETLIPIRLPEAMPVTLSIFDATGRIVYTEKKQYPSGENTVRINNQQLNDAEGVLYYQFETPQASVVKQMLRMRR